MKLTLVIISLVLSTVARAEVPYTFSPNTPAKASEVNQNFEALNDAIDATASQSEANSNEQQSSEARITDLENQIGCPNDNNWLTATHQFTYEYTPSELGQEIVFGSTGYKIVQVPFVEFKSGDVYLIKYPVRLSTNSYWDEDIGDWASEFSEPSGYFSTHHVTSSIACNHFSISNFPVSQLELNESRSISFTNYTGISSTAISTLIINYTFSIKVGETAINLTYQDIVSEDNQLDGPLDYDFTDNIDTDKMNHSDELLSSFDDLIDYIQITKVE